MSLFIDSSNPEEIEGLFKLGVLEGVTTNPLILARESPPDRSLEQSIRMILEVSRGPVSVELTKMSTKDMLEEAAQYHEWCSSRICIKVPMTSHGLEVVSILSEHGIKTNVTCVMSQNQAYLAALAGADYVSIFYGRIRDMGYAAKSIISRTRRLFEQEGFSSRIIVGSIRHIADVNEALTAGAHVVTVVPSVLRAMMWNPRTEQTIEEFNAAWLNRSR